MPRSLRRLAAVLAALALFSVAISSGATFWFFTGLAAGILLWWNKAAALSGATQAVLGDLYEGGFGVAQDNGKALHFYRKAAEQGHARAQHQIGNMYKVGMGGVAQDEGEALRWYYMAAIQGFAGTQYTIGHYYQKGLGGLAQDYKESLRWYHKSAEGGNGFAQARLGDMYATGTGGVAQDDSKAAYWYRKAVRLPNIRPNAYRASWWWDLCKKMNLKLGYMYLLGRGVAQSDRKAARRFRKVLFSWSDLSDAQYSIGLMYEKGEGIRVPRGLFEDYEAGEKVKKDNEKAMRWYRKAALWNNEEAIDKLGKMGVDIRWYRRAGKLGKLAKRILFFILLYLALMVVIRVAIFLGLIG